MVPGLSRTPWQDAGVDEPQTVELVGGPLDGARMDFGRATGLALESGLALIADRCAYMGGRSIYDPRPGDPGRLHWVCDVP